MSDRAIATANKLIKANGIPVTVAYGGGECDASGNVTESTEIGSSYGVLLDYEQSERAGTTIQQHDKKALVAPMLTRQPRTGDRLTMAAKSYDIVSVNVLEPTGVALLYEIQVRA